MTVSTDAERAGDKIQNQFIIKTLSKLRIEIELTQFGKEYLPKKKKPKPSTANIILNGEKLETFSLRSGLTRWHSGKERICQQMQETQEMWVRSLWGGSPGVGNDSLLQYSCLENSMDRGAWWAVVQSQRVGHD